VSESPELAQPQKPDDKRSGPVRKMTLADGLILIAAIGIGLGLARISEDGYLEAAADDDGEVLGMARLSLLWVGACLMISVIPLRLMPPRPRMRRIRRQPGFIAAVAVFYGLIHSVIYSLIVRFWNPPIWAVIDPRMVMGSMIIPAWLILAVSGGWQAERSWIDRFGRGIGIGWIVVYIVYVGAGGFL
jgi:hypothetical protein